MFQSLQCSALAVKSGSAKSSSICLEWEGARREGVWFWSRLLQWHHGLGIPYVAFYYRHHSGLFICASANGTQICRSDPITFVQCCSSQWSLHIYYLDILNLHPSSLFFLLLVLLFLLDLGKKPRALWMPARCCPWASSLSPFSVVGISLREQSLFCVIYFDFRR